jgi:hypothetical protein
MKNILVNVALYFVAAAIVFFLIDICVICLFAETLVGIFTDTWYDEHSVAVIKRAEAIIVFLVVGALLVLRKHVFGIVSRLLERLEQSLSDCRDCSLPADRRPTVLVMAMLLFLGIVPILLNLIHRAFFEFSDFFIWPVAHGGWVLVSAFVLIGLTKRRIWAYYTLIVTLIGNILLASGLAAWAFLRLGQPFYGPHGFAAIAQVGVCIFIIVLLVYLGVCISVAVYLWPKRKCLTPPSGSDRADETEEG